jgi:hypothetical protein
MGTLKRKYSANIDNHEMIVYEYVNEYVNTFDEPACGECPIKKTTTWYVTKDGKFWGQEVFRPYETAEKCSEYKLTVGDKKNFNAVVYDIISQYLM